MSSREDGFSIVELLISAVVLGVMSGAIFIFFGTSVNAFFQIQTTSIIHNEQTSALYRMAQVVRSATRITEASNNAITVYAYFSPQDSTLSQVRYYYEPATKNLKVDRIRATGTAPNYTYPSTATETRVVYGDRALTGSLFSYRDANGNSGPFDSTTYKDIKSVIIDLNTPGTNLNSKAQQKLRVELRSRKTNL